MVAGLYYIIGGRDLPPAPPAQRGRKNSLWRHCTMHQNPPSGSTASQIGTPNGALQSLHKDVATPAFLQRGERGGGSRPPVYSYVGISTACGASVRRFFMLVYECLLHAYLAGELRRLSAGERPATGRSGGARSDPQLPVGGRRARRIVSDGSSRSRSRRGRYAKLNGGGRVV